MGFIMSFEQQVKKLTADNINEIETHYYAALETDHGSGEHWILMTVLDKYGRSYRILGEREKKWYTPAING